MGLDLITLSEYKTYKGISSTNQDSILSSIITKVSQLVKTICRRTFIDFVDDTKEEITHGGIGSTIFLKEYPIISATVELSTDYGQTYDELTEFTDFVIDKENGCLVSITDDFPKYLNGYKITYNGGYEDGLPEDLKLAVFDLVEYYSRNDQAVHSPKAPGTNSVQVEYITTITTQLPSHIQRVLNLYIGSFD